MSNVFFTCGAPGQGKTSLIRALRIARNLQRVITCDPYGDQPDGIETDGVVVGDLAFALKKLDQLLGDGRWSLGFVPSETGAAYEADLLARAAYLRGATLIVDEAHESCGHNTVGEHVLRLARKGRHVGARIWLATLRPADVSRALTAHSERAFFWLKEPADREYVRKTLGAGAERIVKSLQPGEFLYDSGRTSQLCRVEWKKGVPLVTKICGVSQDELEG